MKQDVGALGQGIPRDPIGRDRLQIDAERGFVIGDVCQHPSVVLHSISEGGTGVLHEGAPDAHTPQFPLGLRDVVELEMGRKLVDVHGEQGRREVRGHAVAERMRGRGRTPDVHLAVRVPDGSEESHPLDVIEVEMGEKDVDAGRMVALQRHPEVADAGPGVDHQHASIRGPDLQAGRVAAVTNRLGARRGQRPAAPPDLRLHARSARPARRAPRTRRWPQRIRLHERTAGGR